MSAAWEVLLTEEEIEALLLRPHYSVDALASAREKLEDAHRKLAPFNGAEGRLASIRALLGGTA